MACYKINVEYLGNILICWNGEDPATNQDFKIALGFELINGNMWTLSLAIYAYLWLSTKIINLKLFNKI